MDILELMRSRHSVRQYLAKPIAPELRERLDACAAELNRAGDLALRVVYDEPACFSSRMAHYGRFENVSSYIALIGRRSADLEERCGYYGEKLVLKAQELGLNTCWAALTHGKSGIALAPDEREVILIALGYGRTPGVPHRGKGAAEVCDGLEGAPDWYRRGVEAALLAPTAVNQQRFRFERDGETVRARAGLLGPCLKVDLGIVKCHFALAAGEENFRWA